MKTNILAAAAGLAQVGLLRRVEGVDPAAALRYRELEVKISPAPEVVQKEIEGLRRQLARPPAK